MSSVDWQINKAPLDCTKYLLENEIKCDVNFRIGKDPENIKAHKFILSMRSPVFDRMFNGGFQESESDPVIPDMTTATFKALLRYCYYECLDIEDDVALSILYAAKKYMLPLLEDAARKKLIKLLSVTNVWDIYRYAINVGDNKLIDGCHIYFEKGISPVKEALQCEAFLNLPHEVLLDFLHINDKVDKVLKVSKDKFTFYKNNVGISISEIGLFKACNTWAEAECRRQEIDPTGPNKRTVLGEALFLIRFPTMLQRDLTTVVYPTGILTQVEIVNLGIYIHRDPGSDCQVDFPSKERKFVLTTPDLPDMFAKIGTVFIESRGRLLLSRIWLLQPCSCRVTVRDETSDGSWSMKYDTKYQHHCTDTISGSHPPVYFIDIKPQLLESGIKYSITVERTGIGYDPINVNPVTKCVVNGDMAPLKVTLTRHSKKFNLIYALTLCMV